MNESEIRVEIREMVRNLAKDGRESIRPDSWLGRDLGFTSLDFVRLAAAAQQRFGKVSPLPFQRLFIAPDGSMMIDITLAQFTGFVLQKSVIAVKAPGVPVHDKGVQ